MRDPYLGRGPDGVWHLLWTWGWNKDPNEKRLKIGHSSSKDLIAWTPQQEIFVLDQEPQARNAWAPEAVWDAARKEWIVFWATTIPGRFPDTEQSGDNAYNHRIYAASTSDWVTFTPARLWFDPGFNCIDATVIHAGKRWIMVFKDERKTPLQKRLRLAFAAFPDGPWRARQRAHYDRLGGGAIRHPDRPRVVDLLRSLRASSALRSCSNARLEDVRRCLAQGQLSSRPPPWDGGEDPGRYGKAITNAAPVRHTAYSFSGGVETALCSSAQATKPSGALRTP